ncbi:hypothetical protein [Selenihalanaerobacter shriftii]|uniref:Uncharacterized protein n=1 Tax=Selenihalanaerobacter shriftii TaxID=142842 RepID=A0A1T4JMN5_9FIRM|nr:hypothetical protein [Selenihalanaerobacter shriftii]SJZ31414.1 hypothetical protein SAMN02745118_00218 [Selenihalanaerobacter shriftii]
MSTTDLYRKEVKRIATIIKSEYEPDKIILFGRNEVIINMLIIKETDMKSYERGTVVSGLISNRKLPFNPFVYTPNEITLDTKVGSMTYKEILENGEEIYSKVD